MSFWRSFLHSLFAFMPIGSPSVRLSCQCVRGPTRSDVEKKDALMSDWGVHCLNVPAAGQVSGNINFPQLLGVAEQAAHFSHLTLFTPISQVLPPALIPRIKKLLIQT